MNALMDRCKDILHGIHSFIMACVYGFPSRKLCVIGVTGTDGKSSTILMLSAILERHGYRTAYFSSVQYSDGVDVFPNTSKMTTPGRGFLQGFLARALQKGCSHVVLEITSEGIKQNRHLCIDFDCVLLTNITPEHVERHGGFDRYRDTKLSLLRRAKHVVLNRNDIVSEEFHESLLMPVFTYGPPGTSADLEGCASINNVMRSEIAVRYGAEEDTIQLNLGGPFAHQNALAATAVAVCLGVPLSGAVQALASIRLIPGRFEILCHEPLVIVDYAHTVNAVEQVLKYVREKVAGRLIHVFGAAGGGRDRWKRAELARLSENYADISILTEENPFDEEPERILQEITQGFSSSHTVLQLPRREDAVRKALEIASGEDAIVFTAKGSETVIAGPHRTHRPYEERTYISWLLSTQSKKSSQV